MPFTVTKQFRVNSMRVGPKSQTPSIPLSGLILYVDGSSGTSYPGSGTTWYDLSGAGYNVTLGGPDYTSEYGGGFNFNPSLGDAAVASSNGMGSSAGTIGFWIKSSTGADIYNTTAGAWSQNTFYIEAGALTLRISDGTSGEPDVSISPSLVFDGTARFVCATWQLGGERAIWVDGVKKASLNSTKQPGKSSDFEIGYKSWGASRFNGNMYSIFSYNRALSPTEMSDLYNATKTRFPAQPTPTPTPTPTQTPTPTPTPGGVTTYLSLNTDGTSNSVAYVPYNSAYASLGNLAVEFWFKRNGWGGSYSRIIDHNYGSGFVVCRNGGNDNISFYVNGSSISSNANITDNTWYHVACVRNGSTGYIYLNGALDNSGGMNGATISSTNDIGVGQNKSTDSGNERQAITITDIRLWNISRNSTDISSNYNTHLAGNESGLIGNWQFIQGNALADSSPTSNSIITGSNASFVSNLPY